MNNAEPSSGLLEAVPLVFEIAAHLGKSREKYYALVKLVGEFSDLSVDEIAVRLNVTKQHAKMLLAGAPFEEYLATLHETDHTLHR